MKIKITFISICFLKHSAVEATFSAQNSTFAVVVLAKEWQAEIYQLGSTPRKKQTLKKFFLREFGTQKSPPSAFCATRSLPAIFFVFETKGELTSLTVSLTKKIPTFFEHSFRYTLLETAVLTAVPVNLIDFAVTVSLASVL